MTTDDLRCLDASASPPLSPAFVPEEDVSKSPNEIRRDSKRPSYSQSSSSDAGAPAADDDGPLDEPDVPAKVLALPCCLQVFLRVLMCDAFRANDTLSVRMRKVFIGVGPGIAVFRCLGIIGGLANGAATATVAGAVSQAVAALHIVTLLAVWGWLRCSPRRHAAASDVSLAMAFLWLAAISVLDSSYPTMTLALMFNVLPWVLESERIRSLLCLGLLAFATAGYNHVMVEAERRALTGAAVAPGALTEAELGDRIFQMVVLSSLGGMVLLMVALHIKEAARRARQARATLDVTSQLGSALAMYDTARANDLIRVARDRGEASLSVLAQFEAIVANLNAFRPHLPNWVIDSALQKKLADDPDMADLDDDLDSKPTTTPLRDPHRVHSSSSLGTPRMPTTPSPRGSPLLVAGLSPLQRRGSGTPRSAAMRTSAFDGVSVAAGDPFNARAVVCEIFFTIFDADELDAQMPNSTYVQRLSRSASAGHGFADRIHRLASQTGGAVHGFVGDAVRLSWNAASRATQPEAKAARFLARARADLGTDGVKAWGWAAFGDARVQLAGSAGQQQALLIRPYFCAARDAVRAFSQRYRRFVCDASVYSGANHSVSFRGAGISSMLSLPSPVTDIGKTTSTLLPPNESVAGIYEVLSEREERDDEWLYVLQRNGDSVNPNVVLCRAVDFAVAGDFAKAVDALAANPDTAPLVRSSGVSTISNTSDLITEKYLRDFTDFLRSRSVSF